VFPYSGSGSPRRELNPEDGDSTFIRNVGNYLSFDTV